MPELRLGLGQRQEARLTQQQKHELRVLLALRLELHSPPPVEATRGLDGMGKANTLLTERGLTGVLIGGVAKDIWKTRNVDALARHKDVDVLVLKRGENVVPIKKFEAGIDWWLPKYEKLIVSSLGTQIEGDVAWWENGNKVALGFGISNETQPTLRAGLYIPTPQWLVEMVYAETLARVDQTMVGVSEEVGEKFRKKIEKEMNPTKYAATGVVSLPVFVPYGFQLGIEKLPPEKCKEVPLSTLDLRTLVAINTFNSR